MKIASAAIRNISTRLQSSQVVTFTPNATTKIRQLYKESCPSTARSLLKISVKNQGCSGNSYNFSWVSSKAALDEIVKVEGELEVAVDGKSIFKLIGSVIDWEEGEISSGFTFVNPNAASACGCGESFEVKQ